MYVIRKDDHITIHLNKSEAVMFTEYLTTARFVEHATAPMSGTDVAEKTLTSLRSTLAGDS